MSQDDAMDAEARALSPLPLTEKQLKQVRNEVEAALQLMPVEDVVEAALDRALSERSLSDEIKKAVEATLQKARESSSEPSDSSHSSSSEEESSHRSKTSKAVKRTSRKRKAPSSDDSESSASDDDRPSSSKAVRPKKNKKEGRTLPKCAFCRQKGRHFSDSCPSRSSVESRLRKLRKKRLCVRCYLPEDANHDKCRWKRCYTCGAEGHGSGTCSRNPALQ